MESKIEIHDIVNNIANLDGEDEVSEEIARKMAESLKEEDEISLTKAFELGKKVTRLRLVSILASEEASNVLELFEKDVDEEKGLLLENSPKLGDVLELLLDLEVDSAQMNIPSSTVNQIRRRREYLMEEYNNLENNLELSKSDSLSTASKEWEATIKESLEDRSFIVVSNRSYLDVEKLVQSPEDFFDPHIWEWLDYQPKEDIKESCLAIAYGLPTASVMLSLRAVEYCLRQWYKSDTGREIKRRNWGQVVGELEDQYKDTEEYPPVLSNLSYLKERRNSVSHPDEFPTEREAERMLFRIEGTISEIYNQIGENHS